MLHPQKRIVYNCSIEYYSKYNNLNVAITRYRLNEGQEPPNFSHIIGLREHLPEYVIVGISAST